MSPLLGFYCLNFLTASAFLLSRKLFQANVPDVPQSLFWIGLMVALPAGSAVQHRCRFSPERLLAGCLLALAWMLSGNLLLLHRAPWPVESWYPNIVTICLKDSLLESSFFAPLFMSLGAIELHLFNELRPGDHFMQWLCYCCAIAGLASAIAVSFYVLPEPSPFWIGLTGLAALIALMARWPRPSRAFSATCLGAALALLRMMDYPQSSLRSSFLRSFCGKDAVLVVHDAWNRFCRFTVAKDGDILIGFYDSQFFWVTNLVAPQLVPGGSAPSPLASLAAQEYREITHVSDTASPSARIAILGAGGGAQIRPLLSSPRRSIWAADVIPTRDTMLALDPALADPRSHWLVQDGRQSILRSSGKFDLIYLPSVETTLWSPQQILEPSNRLFTREAFETYRSRLEHDGLVVITKGALFDAQTTFAASCARSLREAGLFARYGRFRDDAGHATVILASPSRDALARAGRKGFDLLSVEQTDAMAEKGSIITDDRPFLAAIAITPRFVEFLIRALLYVLIGCLLCLGLVTRSKGSLAFPAFFCGANYTILLLTFQMLLGFELANPLDAPILGTLTSLALLGLGACGYRRPTAMWALTALGAAGGLARALPPWPTIEGLLCLWSGGLFPRLIHRYEEDLSSLLILDGLGAVFGGALYCLVPLIYGIKALLLAVAALYFVTVFSVRWVTSSAGWPAEEIGAILEDGSSSANSIESNSR